MPPRLRRFVAAVGVLAFLVFYVWAAIGIGERLPCSTASPAPPGACP